MSNINFVEKTKGDSSKKKKRKMTLTIQKIGNTQYKNINTNKNKNSEQKKLKVASIIGSTLGVACSIGMIAKDKPLYQNGIIKNLKKLELNGSDVMKIATSSVAGGYLAGSSVDKKNRKAKFKEGVIQLVGNYIVPSAFVSGGIKLNNVLNKKFKFPPKTGPMQFVFGLLSLVLGVVVGNKVSREINSKVFKEDEYRPLTYKDWSMQLDNVCLVTSMAGKGTNVAKAVSKVIPVAHIIPGYLTGMKQG